MPSMFGNRTAVDLSFTLITYGALIGTGTLMVIAGAYLYIGYLQGAIAQAAPVLVFITIATIVGWMLITLGFGGAAYVLLYEIDEEE